MHCINEVTEGDIRLHIPFMLSARYSTYRYIWPEHMGGRVTHACSMTVASNERKKSTTRAAHDHAGRITRAPPPPLPAALLCPRKPFIREYRYLPHASPPLRGHISDEILMHWITSWGKCIFHVFLWPVYAACVLRGLEFHRISISAH